MSGLDYADAERSVLGSMLMSMDAVADVDEVLNGEDYASPRHELIHDAVVALANEAALVDPVAVADRLSRQGDLDRCGGHAYLHKLAAEVASPATARWHAGIVREAAMKRRVRAVGSRLEQLGETDGSALEVVNAARTELDAVVEVPDQDVSNGDAIEDAIASLDEDPGIPMPWGDLTRVLGGWKPQELVVLGARPSVGKSVFGIAAAMDAAYRGHRAVLFSMEMRKRELWLRMLCAAGTVDGMRVQHRDLRASDRAKLADAAAKLREQPLIVDDRFSLTVAQIQAKLRTLARQGPIGLVVVDYLQLVEPADKRAQRVQQVDQIARDLKGTSRMFNVPVLALAQLNRAAVGRSDPTPRMTDFREAGGIENTADSAILMHRELDPADGDPSDLKLLIGKNRHGPTSRMDYQFEGQYFRINEPGTSWGARYSA